MAACAVLSTNDEQRMQFVEKASNDSIEHYKTVILEAHEQRIQLVEKAATEFSAHAKAEEYRFQMISDQILRLGEQVSTSMGKLETAVEALATKTASHHKYLHDLNEERNQTAARKKKISKFGWGLCIAACVAVAGQFGESVWGWFKRLTA